MEGMQRKRGADNGALLMDFAASVKFCDWIFQVFGLGNKTYEHYNEIGKICDKKLEELGAERIFELGLGDDDGKYYN